MFSRPGRQTISEYIAFKEEHPAIPEEDEEPEVKVPIEVQKEQLLNDLNGDTKDALEEHYARQFKENEERKKK